MTDAPHLAGSFVASPFALAAPAAARQDGAPEPRAPVFLGLGFDEPAACAGAGLAPCRFQFTDGDGNRLAVVTQGQAFEGEPPPAVSQAFFVCGA